MDELNFKPVRHNHKDFLAKAEARESFAEAYDALDLEYRLASQMLKARSRAGLTQDAVAERVHAVACQHRPATGHLGISTLHRCGVNMPVMTVVTMRCVCVLCDVVWGVCMPLVVFVPVVVQLDLVEQEEKHHTAQEHRKQIVRTGR